MDLLLIGSQSKLEGSWRQSVLADQPDRGLTISMPIETNCAKSAVEIYLSLSWVKLNVWLRERLIALYFSDFFLELKRCTNNTSRQRQSFDSLHRRAGHTFTSCHQSTSVQVTIRRTSPIIGRRALLEGKRISSKLVQQQQQYQKLGSLCVSAS